MEPKQNYIILDFQIRANAACQEMDWRKRRVEPEIFRNSFPGENVPSFKLNKFRIKDIKNPHLVLIKTNVRR